MINCLYLSIIIIYKITYITANTLEDNLLFKFIGKTFKQQRYFRRGQNYRKYNHYLLRNVVGVYMSFSIKLCRLRRESILKPLRAMYKY